MNIAELLEEAGYQPKRKAACYGGEYSSPCPFCKDGDDRFLVWPNRQNKNGEYKGGRFTCRICGKYGDAITFLRELYGLPYKEACSKLRIQPRESNYPKTQPQPKFSIANDPPALWQEKALSLVDWCHAKLMSTPRALEQVTKRGFSIESTKRFKLGFNSGEQGKNIFRDRETWGLAEYKDESKLKKLWLPIGLTIPTFCKDGNVIKIKIRRTAYEKETEAYEKAIEEGEKPKYKPQKYAVVSGSKECPSVYGNTSLPYVFIVESEFDGLLIQQFTSDLLFCVSLGGSSKPIDLHTHQLLEKTPNILFCPDYDEAGKKAWDRWKKMFPRIKRILTPQEKAPGDAYLVGVDLREWISEGIEEIKGES